VEAWLNCLIENLIAKPLLDYLRSHLGTFFSSPPSSPLEYREDDREKGEWGKLSNTRHDCPPHLTKVNTLPHPHSHSDLRSHEEVGEGRQVLLNSKAEMSGS
jgi:hypothetical protein